MTWLGRDAVRGILDGQTTAFRVAWDRGVDVLWLDGDLLVLAETLRVPPETLVASCVACGLVVRRVFVRERVRQPREADVPRLVWGERGGATEREVLECGLRFGIDLAAGYSVGIFPDQRANRRRLAALGAGRVLNCFAYTAAFSVVGARGGAEVVSIDLARRALERGKANMTRNGLDPGGHRWMVDDVFAVLPRLARRGERFDAIILDPPTFSRGAGGRVFRAKEGLGGLLRLAVACAAGGAWVLVSTNCTEIDQPALLRMARPFADEIVQEPPDPDYADGGGATALWMRVG
jgi:23S rRNA (cytosine1962-C5)-methyltransferase